MGESILLSEKIQYYLQDMFATMKNVNIKLKKHKEIDQNVNKSSCL